ARRRLRHRLCHQPIRLTPSSCLLPERWMRGTGPRTTVNWLPPSWPGLSRPPTSCLLPTDVDARDKPAHDGEFVASVISEVDHRSARARMSEAISGLQSAVRLGRTARASWPRSHALAG